MVKAARTDTLVERVDQLADVYGEVLLGLYDELTDQRERTEAVAARADAVLGEARRLMDDMNALAGEARTIEQQATAAALAAAGAPASAGTPEDAAAAEARAVEALARLAALESATSTLEHAVQERTDAAVSRCETLTAGLSSEMRAHVQQSVADVRAEVQSTVAELRQHVRDLADAVTREAHEAARRGGGAVAVAPPDTAGIVEEVRREASAAIADQVRRQAADSVAEELQRQRLSTPLAPSSPMGEIDLGSDANAAVLAQLRADIEARTAGFGAAAERAQELAGHLDRVVADAQAQLQEAKTDRAAAAFALRESRAELDAAKRALDMSDYTFTLDRLRRTEMLLYGTTVIAIAAVLLALWALLS
jgi:hypothetical protein